MKKRSFKNGLFKGNLSFITLLVLLSGALIVSLLFAVTIGSSNISMADVYKVIIRQLFGIGDASYAKGSIHDVVWFIRLPRLILAVGVGIGLSVCGTVMQAIVKNPLADPYVLGISSGAYLGAVIEIVLGIGSVLGGNFVGILAFIGAFVVSLAVLTLANIGSRANTAKLLLSGMALSAVCSAIANFIVYMTKDNESVVTVNHWLLGSLSGANWTTNLIVLSVVLAGFIFFLTQYRTLNLMLYGDETAITLGTNLHVWRHVYLVVCAAIVGVLVYAAGMIGFVGLVIPHCVRMLVGTDHKKVVPLSALIGAIFLIWVDVCCRVLLKGNELPVGVLTGIIGAPVFIYLMIRRKYGFGGKDA